VHLAPNHQGQGHMTHVTVCKYKHRLPFHKPMVKGQLASRLYNRWNQNKTQSRAHTEWYSIGSYVNIMCDQGLGLSPSPVAPQLYTYANIYKYFATYITRNNQWCIGWRLFPSLSPLPRGLGVDSGQRHNFKPMYI
jgi:hypothetical protein